MKEASLILLSALLALPGFPVSLVASGLLLPQGPFSNTNLLLSREDESLLRLSVPCWGINVSPPLGHRAGADGVTMQCLPWGAEHPGWTTRRGQAFTAAVMLTGMRMAVWFHPIAAQAGRKGPRRAAECTAALTNAGTCPTGSTTTPGPPIRRPPPYTRKLKQPPSNAHSSTPLISSHMYSVSLDAISSKTSPGTYRAALVPTATTQHQCQIYPFSRHQQLWLFFSPFSWVGLLWYLFTTWAVYSSGVGLLTANYYVKVQVERCTNCLVIAIKAMLCKQGALKSICKLHGDTWGIKVIC